MPGFMSGFAKRAGEVAREQDMLDLQSEQNRRKALSDQYSKWADDPNNQPWSRDLAAQRRNLINMTPWNKKLPKEIEQYQDLFQQKVGLGTESGRYSPEQLSQQAAQRAGGIAGAETKATEPIKSQYRIEEIEAQKKGTVQSSRPVMGQNLLDQGITTTSFGAQIQPKFQYQEDTLFGMTEPRISLIPEKYGTTLYHELYPDENGNIVYARPYQTGNYGSRRYMDVAEGAIPQVSAMTETGERVTESVEDPFNPGYRKTVAGGGGRQSTLQPFSSRSGAVQVTPTAPPQGPAAAPTQPSPPPGAAPAAPTGSSKGRFTGGTVDTRLGRGALPHPEKRNMSEVMHDMAMGGADVLKSVETSMPTLEQLAAITGPQDPARLGALETLRSLRNYYPSDYWEAQIEKLTPAMVPEEVRGSTELIKDKIRDVVNNPNLWKEQDYKGDAGMYIRNAMSALKIPRATQPGAVSADKESYAFTTLQAIQQLRRLVMSGDNASRFLGIVKGRAVNVASRIGDIPMTSFMTKEQAQELITRAKYFVIMEAKVLMGSRPAVSWAQKLEDVSAKPNMTLGMFLGALNGAEQHAWNVVRDAYHQRYGPAGEQMLGQAMASFPGSVRSGDFRVASPINERNPALDWSTIYNDKATLGHIQRSIPDANGDLWWAIPWDNPDPNKGGPDYENLNTLNWKPVERVYPKPGAAATVPMPQ